MRIPGRLPRVDPIERGQLLPEQLLEPKAGDSILLRAEMDLIVGLTACSAEMSNNYKFKPIGYEIVNPGDEKAG